MDTDQDYDLFICIYCDVGVAVSDGLLVRTR